MGVPSAELALRESVGTPEAAACAELPRGVQIARRGSLRDSADTEAAQRAAEEERAFSQATQPCSSLVCEGGVGDEV